MVRSLLHNIAWDRRDRKFSLQRHRLVVRNWRVGVFSHVLRYGKLPLLDGSATSVPTKCASLYIFAGQPARSGETNGIICLLILISDARCCKFSVMFTSRPSSTSISHFTVPPNILLAEIRTKPRGHPLQMTVRSRLPVSVATSYQRPYSRSQNQKWEMLNPQPHIICPGYDLHACRTIHIQYNTILSSLRLRVFPILALFVKATWANR